MSGETTGRARQSRTQAADPLELILSRAEGVRRLGPDRAVFKAPTREDRTPSVSIARGADGSVLLHDFGGDSAADILAALGLTLASLFPARERREMTTVEKNDLRQHGKLAGWSAALAMLDYETCIVLIAASDTLAGMPLSADDMERVRAAVRRINGARAVLCPEPKFRPQVTQ